MQQIGPTMHGNDGSGGYVIETIAAISANLEKAVWYKQTIAAPGISDLRSNLILHINKHARFDENGQLLQGYTAIYQCVQLKLLHWHGHEHIKNPGIIQVLKLQMDGFVICKHWLIMTHLCSLLIFYMATVSPG